MKKIVTISILVVLVIAGIIVGTLYVYSKKPVSDLIVVISPVKDSQISSPLTISGRARGEWFFEGSFPIILLDSNRNTVAEGHATAQGEWITDNFVKFLGNIQFNNYIKGQKGTLVLKKDNPSGLSENDKSIEIPIIFK